jgi:coenzyme F420 hydrogenase subunit beta
MSKKNRSKYNQRDKIGQLKYRGNDKKSKTMEVFLGFTHLERTVITNNFCCCCGLCVAVCPRNNLTMRENGFSELFPDHSGTCGKGCDLCQQVCPFAEGNEDEEALGSSLFKGQENFVKNESIGWIHDTFVGRVTEMKQRMQAPSGGMTTAVLISLLQRGDIDAAIVVDPESNRPWFRSIIATSPDQILASRGSTYHTVDLSETLRAVINGPECKYAVVALPCAVKAIRLAQQRIPMLRRRISLVLGLTCGSCRSLNFTDLLVGLLGGGDGLLRFRSKHSACQANDFSFEMGNRKKRIGFRKGLFGFLFMNHIGELKSCLFCDDIFAELADGTFMDAWLPEFINDPSGMNLIVSRNTNISTVVSELFENGISEGKHITSAQIEESQLGVIEKKRAELPFRCDVASRSTWVPKKRFKMLCPDNLVSEKAVAQLRLWDKLRSILAHDIAFLRTPRGLIRQFTAWFICLRLYMRIRKEGVTVYNSRSVFMMQNIRPRAILRSLFQRG